MSAVDRDRIAAAVAEILAAIGEDPARPGLETTPARVAEAYAEFFSGIGRDAADDLGDPVPLEDGLTAETVLLRDIEFRSVCEHHLLPFIGTAHVAYLPGDTVVGLGRIPRMIETLASRPQVQERLTEQIADTLVAATAARGVLVVLDASHACVTTRGARQSGSTTVTVAARGAYTEPAARAELITLIGRGVA
ncbi:GTP cyclohydrolase I FolE [Leifsonia sp. AG29]|uniref:GTP cyclohydrolase I FolE n=1 Tax=Leifsonia sp. AG29 TaxID=2598860 RepID=UPI00131DEFFA|nr:GTP cyclohydrolase I FolE [Leifsonia sp. AG29]